VTTPRDLALKAATATLLVSCALLAYWAAVQPAKAMPICGYPPTDCGQYRCNTATGDWVQTGTKVNGTACNDGNNCTTGDKCQAGVCVGTSSAVISDNNACTADYQDPVSCAVVHTPLTNACCSLGQPTKGNTCCSNGTILPNSTLCTTNNPCVLMQSCRSGVCTGGVQAMCIGPDQCHYAGTCDPAAGGCVYQLKLNAPCDDGLKCTTGDVCTPSGCVGTPITCPMPDDCHIQSVCSPATGTCPAAAPKSMGSQCGEIGSCTCSAGASCQYSTNRTTYCYDATGNSTATLVRNVGNACIPFTCP
jgi:hypothetical protein